jgi:predicted secreted Zn-dependent protease
MAKDITIKNDIQVEGLGDVVAKVIKKTTGIEAKKDCGCDKRRKLLNKWVPFHKRNGGNSH